MNGSIKIIGVKGIDVRVHLTFLLILVWAAYRWSSSTQAGIQGVVFGIVVTMLLFFSVTLHEFGHSLQALKYGVHVRNITLMPMGGVAQMEEMPEKPHQEFWISISGPLVNFGIAALLMGTGIFLSAQALTTPDELIKSFGEANWTGMLAYLTVANLGLGLFNLIPAFPMDGGRILRALLALKLNYARATAIAAKVGQGLAFLLGLWGFASDSWTLVLIAIFVWMGAQGESRQVQAKSVLGDLRVRQAMTQHPLLLTTDDTLGRAVELTLTTAQADFPVMDGGKLVGMLTEGDLLKGLRAFGPEERVERATRHPVPVGLPSDLLFQAQQQMAAARLNALPILERDGWVVGLLTAEDINEAYRLLSVNQKLSPATGQA